MNKFLCLIAVAAVPVFSHVADGCPHGGKMQCMSSGKKMMNEMRCHKTSHSLAEAKAGPYVVKLCEWNGEKGKDANLCVLDSAGNSVKIKDLSISVNGKPAEVKKRGCGYNVTGEAAGKEIHVAFKSDRGKYQCSLKPGEGMSSTPVNSVCPVMGNKVNPKITVEYKGKTIGLCCNACVEMFKKNPEKYMKKLK